MTRAGPHTWTDEQWHKALASNQEIDPGAITTALEGFRVMLLSAQRIQNHKMIAFYRNLISAGEWRINKTIAKQWNSIQGELFQ